MLNLKKHVLLIAALAIASLLVVGCSDDDENKNNPMTSANPQPSLDIVETAAAAGNFTTLLAAAEAAGLVDALKADGPLTVFAPTDDAFAALPEGTVEALLQDPDALAAILTYHVVAGEVRAEQVVNLSSAQTLNGASVTITVTGDGVVMIDNAMVIATDIETSNGIIHVIDAVIIPGAGEPEAPTMDIVETATAAGNFNTLLAAVAAADLVDALKSEGPLTVFAPTDEAFAALPEGTVEALLQDIDALTAILTYHVVAGAVTSDQVVNMTSVPTLNGAELTISVTNDGSVKVDNATVVVTDIETSNGVIHVIDAVVIPNPSRPGASQTATAWWGGSYSFGGGWIARAIKDGRLKWLTSRLSLYTVSRLTGLETLTTAVKAAGLKYTLMRSGPFTLFGPTEEAFGALPAGTVEALLQDPETLENILLYHVVPGVVEAADVVTLTEATMANGQTVSISVNGGVMVNDANVIVVDIPAKNGVLHLIDKVLLP